MTDITFISVPVDQHARFSAVRSGAWRGLWRDARRHLASTARTVARLVGLAVLAGAVWYGADNLWSLTLQFAHFVQGLLQAAWSVMTATAGLGAPY